MNELLIDSNKCECLGISPDKHLNFVIKEELHPNSWHLAFINKLQFFLILRSLAFKVSKY